MNLNLGLKFIVGYVCSNFEAVDDLVEKLVPYFSALLDLLSRRILHIDIKSKLVTSRLHELEVCHDHTEFMSHDIVSCARDAIPLNHGLGSCNLDSWDANVADSLFWFTSFVYPNVNEHIRNLIEVRRELAVKWIQLQLIFIVTSQVPYVLIFFPLLGPISG